MTQRQVEWQGMNWCRQTTRLAVYLRDGMACVWCAASVEDGTQLTLDHVRPVSLGGTNVPVNLVTSCKRCNDSRGNRSVAGFARVVAAYLDRGTDAADIVAHVRQVVRRAIPRAEARKLIARRGSVARALKAYTA